MPTNAWATGTGSDLTDGVPTIASDPTRPLPRTSVKTNLTLLKLRIVELAKALGDLPPGSALNALEIL